ncbi:MAG: hypothetical protein ACOYN0_09960, partial [Phycisphaerales bacterium]
MPRDRRTAQISRLSNASVSAGDVTRKTVASRLRALIASAGGSGAACEVLEQRAMLDAVNTTIDIAPPSPLLNGSTDVAVSNRGERTFVYVRDDDPSPSVAAWAVYLRQHDAAGQPLGAEVRLGSGDRVSVAQEPDEDGRIAVASFAPDGAGAGTVDIRYLTRDGTPLWTRSFATADNASPWPAVSVNRGGDVAVAYHSAMGTHPVVQEILWWGANILYQPYYTNLNVAKLASSGDITGYITNQGNVEAGRGVDVVLDDAGQLFVTRVSRSFAVYDNINYTDRIGFVQPAYAYVEKYLPLLGTGGISLSSFSSVEIQRQSIFQTFYRSQGWYDNIEAQQLADGSIAAQINGVFTFTERNGTYYHYQRTNTFSIIADSNGENVSVANSLQSPNLLIRLPSADYGVPNFDYDRFIPVESAYYRPTANVPNIYSMLPATAAAHSAKGSSGDFGYVWGGRDGQPIYGSFWQENNRQVWVETLLNDGTPLANNSAVNEGQTVKFRIWRSGMRAAPLKVWYHIDGTANNADHTGNTRSFVTIPANQDYADVIVQLYDQNDPIDPEFGNDTLRLNLDADQRTLGQQGNPTGEATWENGNGVLQALPGTYGFEPSFSVDPARWQATVEIVDTDQRAVKVTSNNATGGELGDIVQFDITRGGDVSLPVIVNMDISGTATIVSDYSLEVDTPGVTFDRSGTVLSVSFPAGVQVVRFSALPIQDTQLPIEQRREGIEWIHVELLDGIGYTKASDPNLHQVRIGFFDDDIDTLKLVQVVGEANEATQSRASFVINRSEVSYIDDSVSVDFTFLGTGSTASSSDYVVEQVFSNGGIDTFVSLSPNAGGVYNASMGAGQGSVVIAVRAAQDSIAETDERLVVQLVTSPDYFAHPTLNRLELVIREDPNDQAVVSIEAVDPWAGETNRANGQFVLRRTGGVFGDALSVTVSVLGNAYYGIDWTSPNLDPVDPSVVTFAPGQAETVVNVVPLDDSLSEDTEAVTLTVQQTGPYRTSSEVASTATVFVTDFAGGGGTKAQWTWSMPDRYGVDRNNDGRFDVPNTQAYANPTNGFDVRFDAGESTSGAGVLSYLWTIANQAGVVQFTQTLSAFTAQLFEQIYVVSLRVTDQLMIMSEQTQLVEVNDILIVSAGDSVAAGEGNPVIRRFNVLETLFGSPPIPLLGGNSPLPLGWWADDGIGATPDDPYGLTVGSVEYEHAAAHRSTLAASSLTAMEIERRDPRSSVTFVFVAQTGASITDGILNPKVDGADNRYDNDSEEPPFPNFELADGEGDTRRFGRSQLDQISHLIGNRTIDAMTMSVGANDIGFSEILSDYVKRYHYRAGIFFTGESKALDEIRDELRRRIARLPSLYADLAGGIQATLGSNLSNASNLVIQGYFDPTGNSNGVPADVLQDSVMGSLTGAFLTLVAGSWNPFYYITDTPLRIDPEEAAHGRQHAVIPLNSAVGRASSQFGWTYVSAPTGFLTRGYSASESWIRSANDSRIYQGSEAWLKPWGAVHPNEPGQAAYSNSQLATFLGDDRPVPSFSGLVGGVVRVTEGQSALVSITDGRVRRAGGLTYQWDLDYDGRSFSPDPSITGSSAKFSAVGKRYPASGKIALRATDQLGRSSFAVVDVAVTNGGSGRYVNEVSSVDAGAPFWLGLDRVREQLDPARLWRVDWGDGSYPAAGGAPAGERVAADWRGRSHVYGTSGLYSYRVWLTDAGGEVEVQAGLVSVVGNDPFPTVSVVPLDPSRAEGGAPLRFQFIRTGQLQLPLTIGVSFDSGSGIGTN